MEIRQLTTFRMLATTLSFTRTAAALNYVQSSVTAQIQTLEEELGVRLFDRLGKRVALTEAGQRLLPYAEKVLNLTEEARLAVAHTDGMVGTITLSAPESLCAYRLPPLFQKFRQAYPQVRLNFRPLPFSKMRQSVADGEIDVSFQLEESLVASGLMVEVLIKEPLLLLAPPLHCLTSLTRVTLVDLVGETLLLTEAGCSYRNTFERTLGKENIQLSSVVELESVEAIKQCVMVGMGLTVLPAVAVEKEVAQGLLVPLAWNDPDFYVLAYMVWHKERWLSAPLQAFLCMARDMLKSQPAEKAVPLAIAQP
jgi:DNA-binding transcriptional LysR family regulator